MLKEFGRVIKFANAKNAKSVSQQNEGAAGVEGQEKEEVWTLNPQHEKVSPQRSASALASAVNGGVDDLL